MRPNWYPRKLAVGQDGNLETIRFLKEFFPIDFPLRYAEFGAYKGDTVLRVAETFPNSLAYVFDYDRQIKSMYSKLRHLAPRIKFFPNTQFYQDSYAYSLAKLIEDDRQLYFNYCFIDGAHTFPVDALTFYLCDQVLLPGGFLDFDDYDWTINTSRLSKSRVIRKSFSPRQREEKQVAFLLDNFVTTNKNYEVVYKNRLFKKK